ncbi:MAG: zinc-binding alcohol dehydrogenase, partial [Chloroflexota bacterium]|nr:zinc-binding alcohol dehydrogenase [Chloroflexota bacterium]
MSKASAIWFTSPKHLSFKDVEIGNPGDNQLEIETLFSGISHGTEMLVYNGLIPTDMEIDSCLSTMEGSFRFPIKYGYASVGRIVDLGQGVTDFSTGDLVFAHFPHQTRYIIPKCSATKLPNDITPQLGVFLATLETAINCTWDASANLGEVVVIFGQGIVGLLITQLLSLGPARTVIAIEPNKRRREISLKIGASTVLDPTA